MKIPPQVQRELDALRVPYSLDTGSKHVKIRVQGRLVGILPRGNTRDETRTVQNTVSQIRRAGRGVFH